MININTFRCSARGQHHVSTQARAIKTLPLSMETHIQEGERGEQSCQLDKMPPSYLRADKKVTDTRIMISEDLSQQQMESRLDTCITG